MIAVLQRVSRASVTVDGREVGRIGPGLMALVAVVRGDDRDDADLVAGKLEHLRIFPDEEGRMDRSLAEIEGEVLLVSQFTLAGDTRKGRRPSFTDAAPAERAEALFGELVEAVRRRGIRVATGEFGAMMEVELLNDGPVTLIVDSRETRRGGRRDPAGREDDGSG